MDEKIGVETSIERRKVVESVSSRSGLSIDAVNALLSALQSGGGRMAQFNHSELGGMGQWSSGMLMIGEFNNSSLKAKVQSACEFLTEAMQEGRLELEQSKQANSAIGVPETWWDSSLGTPSTLGGQNEIQYAYFPALKRLAIKRDSAITLYDTGAHEISGVSQQQGSTSSLVFESQHGLVAVKDLKVIS